MSAHPPVVFDRVWKRFHRGERHDSLRDLLSSVLRPWQRAREADDLFWAVQDVSFEVQAGEALGVIGPNGAGKSTILKLLTRLLAPTRGRCEVRGRTGALIEIAAGFHPDLTGRENIYLQGAVLGMRRQQIREKLDPIVEFAGIGPFLDTPVKRYSSGMHARLGFSIAAHIDPDVLIIDEVLAVGDLTFRRKCYERMMEFRQNGVAIVFVSHDLPSVTALCNRAMLLHKGAVLSAGPTREVVAEYSNTALVSQELDEATLHVTTAERDATGAPWVLTPGERINVSVDIEYRCHAAAAGLWVEVADLLRNVQVYSATTETVGLTPRAARPGDRLHFDLSLSANLTDGLYVLTVTALDHAVGRPVSTPWKRRFNVEEETAIDGPANLFLRCRHMAARPMSPMTGTITAGT